MLVHEYAVFALYLCVLFVYGDDSIVCENTEYGRICKGAAAAQTDRFIPYRLSLAEEGDLLLVGSRNFLHSFSTNTLNTLQTVDLTPSQGDTMQCQSTVGTIEACEVNSILFVKQIPERSLNVSLQARYNNTVLVCGASAFTPSCTVHSLSNLSDWFYLQSKSNNYEGFSPYSTNSLHVATIASNGAFYSATNLEKFSDRRRLGISFNPLSGDTSFNTISSDRDPFWVADTDFISLYEVDDHIYVFGREDSNEEKTLPRVKFGRAIRICKSDQGVENDGDKPRFSTFQKIRITCPNAGDGSFPEFFYNNLQATYFYTAADGSHWIYATFIAQANGPVGSAICKFGFNPNDVNSLADIFNNAREYYDSSSTDVTQQLDPFTCPGTNRNKLDALGYQLIKGVALPTGGNAVHTQNGLHYTFINVDVYEFNSSTYEVMFVSTKSMSIEVICHKDGQPFITKMIATYTETIENFILNKFDVQDGIRKLFVGGESFIASIILGNCHTHSSCKECLESNDPYCAWVIDSRTCINKLVTSNSTQVLEASEANANICPSIPTQSTTKIPVTMTHTESTSVMIESPSKTTQTACVTHVLKVSTITRRVSAATTLPSAKITATTAITNTISLASIEPSVAIGGVDTQVASLSAKEIGEMIGAGVGGLLIGLVVGLLMCFAYTMVRGKVASKPMPTTNGGHYLPNERPITQNGISNHNAPSVEQYTITVSLPKKTDDAANIGSPIPSLSPPAIDDSELEDDVISDLPQPTNNYGNKIKKWGIPKGRTPSTRWLRASESSNAGSESPVSPS